MNNLYPTPTSFHAIEKIIMTGCYGSRNFEISTFSGHPCAYVSFPEGIDMDTYDEVECDAEIVNGGFSFLGQHSGQLMLGWDYGHKDDFNAFHPENGGKKWDLSSIMAEVVGVIDCLNSID